MIQQTEQTAYLVRVGFLHEELFLFQAKSILRVKSEFLF